MHNLFQFTWINNWIIEAKFVHFAPPPNFSPIKENHCCLFLFKLININNQKLEKKNEFFGIFHGFESNFLIHCFVCLIICLANWPFESQYRSCNSHTGTYLYINMYKYIYIYIEMGMQTKKKQMEPERRCQWISMDELIGRVVSFSFPIFVAL